MAVVTLKYIRNKEQIKQNLRYITHRAGHEKEKMTRDIFTNTGFIDKKEFYRQVAFAGRGTAFFKFVISPDPRREDAGRDLDLPHITRRTIRKLEKAIGRKLFSRPQSTATIRRYVTSTASFLSGAASQRSTSGRSPKSPALRRQGRLDSSAKRGISPGQVPATRLWPPPAAR